MLSISLASTLLGLAQPYIAKLLIDEALVRRNSGALYTVALLMVVVPGEPWVRLMAVLGGALVGMVYAASFVQQTTEHRAMRAGWPAGYAQAVRDRRYESRRAEELIRYAARYRPPTPPGSRGPGSPGPASGGPGSR